MSYLIFALLAATALQFVGWWLLAVVAFVWGVVLRGDRWPALRVGALVAVLGALRLAWLVWSGAPAVEAGELTAAVTTLPVMIVWLLALFVPALVASSAAVIGVVVGKRVLFG